MQDDDDARDHDLDRANDPATFAAKTRRRAAGTRFSQATRARERAALAKQHELEAHVRAIELHERAAELQERLGHHDRAATARAHAQHARELHAQALAEQSEQER
jgi:integrase